MNFTREPIIETVVTPREGCKLVVRNSKGQAQEDYFVDAVEIVSFGSSLFFRSLEKPKSFLVPVSDYEVLELRETRMVLKHVPSERSLKIGGGKEPAPRPQREAHPEPRHQEKEATPVASDGEVDESQPASATEAGAAPVDPRAAERKRERRRRGRRGRAERAPDGTTPPATPADGAEVSDDASEDQKLESSEEGQKPEHSESEPVEKKQPSLLSRIFFAPPPPLMVRARLQPKPVEAEIPPSDVESAPAIEEKPVVSHDEAPFDSEDKEEPKSDE